MQAAGHLVQLGVTGADPLDALARVEKRIEPALIFLNHLSRTRQSGLRLRIAELEQALLGARQNLLRILLAYHAPVHQMLGSENDPAENRLVLDDANVAVEIENPWQAVIQRYQIAEAIAGFQFVIAQQLIGERDAIDPLAAMIQLSHALEDTAVLFEAEIVAFDCAGYLNEVRIVHQDRAQ